MLNANQMTWGLRLATISIGGLLLIQGEIMMACLMFLLTGGLEWFRQEEQDN